LSFSIGPGASWRAMGAMAARPGRRTIMSPSMMSSPIAPGRPPGKPGKPGRFERKIPFALRQWCAIRPARPKDRDGIRALYDDIYGPDYPLALIRDPKVTLATIKDPDHFWLVLEHNKRLVGSVLFAIDNTDRIGKVYGAVVRPELRGHDLMQHAIAAGLEELLAEDRPLELFYATTRTVTPAPGKLVARLGFVSCGVFPNVHRVSTSETHGLDVYFRPRAFRERLLAPRLVPEVVEFFQIARETLHLPDEPVIEPVDLPPPARDRFQFTVLDDPAAVARIYRQRLKARQLRFSFFPFHEPHVLFATRDGHEVFVHHTRADGYGAILGVRSDVVDFAGFLDQLCDAAHGLGLRYIELLVSAFDPLKQAQAWQARFLPCAYFPAMKITTGGKRMDYLVFSRSFETLDFTQIQLDGTRKRYLQAFVKCWYAMLVAHAPDFEKVDRLF
jgi:RimJ/RimL family protein N-acetyltransferase